MSNPPLTVARTPNLAAMRRRRSSVPLLAAALMVALITSCGVKANDNLGSGTPTVSVPEVPSLPTGPNATTTTEGAGIGGSTGTVPKRSTTTLPGRTTTSSTFGGPSGDPGSPGFTRDFLIKIYKQSGLTDAQATCLTDGIISSGIIDPNDPSSAANVDPSAFSDLFVKCNISISDFGGSPAQPGG